MRKNLLIAVLLVFALTVFTISHAANAETTKVPRGFDLYSEYTIDGCTYNLWVALYESSKGDGFAIIDLDSPCLSEHLTFFENVDRNEFNINGSLKSAALKATILDGSTGRPVVITDLKFRSVENKPSDFVTPALVSGTVVFPELNLTFTFYQDQAGGLWYGT